MGSTGGVTLLGLETMVMGEMLVGIPSRMLLPSLHSPEIMCLLAEVVSLTPEVES